jgi:uncharacterized membrane protein YgcG
MTKLIPLFVAFLFFLFPKNCLAVSSSTSNSVNISVTQVTYPNGYVIENFQSNIKVNQDTSLTIAETIQANFLIEKRGIIRLIPTLYTANGKTINAGFEIISVTDENKKPYNYSTGRLTESYKIQIGDADKTITGKHTYIITYEITKVLLRYTDYDEVYWNITGHEWDTPILKASAIVDSPFAKITKTNCFTKDCAVKETNNQFVFNYNKQINPGEDFTVVVALDKNNQLVFPNPIVKTINTTGDNWGYLFALMPLVIMILAWFKKGRDKKYLEGTIYYKPDNPTTKTVPFFAREYLPQVYSPIDNLTPSQVGTIIDERVNIQDVIAEIIELGRLGYLKIEKTTKNDYVFTNLGKDPTKLKDFQKYLFESIFKTAKYNAAEGLSEIAEEQEPDKTLKIGDQKIVSLASLKDHFYPYLSEFRNKLYQNLAAEQIFDGNPQTAKLKWGIFYFLMMGLFFFPVMIFTATSYNGGPFGLYLLSVIPAFPIILNMSRRTAWGYSLLQQINGLKYYITLGKWRQEIMEKHLFFEEILPLAISLGIVNQITKDMQELGVEPPRYFSNVAMASFASDFDHFYSSSSSNLVSSPASSNSSGHSSWSGGSGFSGGSSGGGFGGGGGSSW